MLMRLRSAADNVQCPLELEFSKVQGRSIGYIVELPVALLRVPSSNAVPLWNKLIICSPLGMPCEFMGWASCEGRHCRID